MPIHLAHASLANSNSFCFIFFLSDKYHPFVSLESLRGCIPTRLFNFYHPILHSILIILSKLVGIKHWQLLALKPILMSPPTHLIGLIHNNSAKKRASIEALFSRYYKLCICFSWNFWIAYAAHLLCNT